MTFIRTVFKELADNSEAFDFYHLKKDLEKTKETELENRGAISKTCVMADALLNDRFPKKQALKFSKNADSYLSYFCHDNYYHNPIAMRGEVVGCLNSFGDLTYFPINDMKGRLSYEPSIRLGTIVENIDRVTRDFFCLKLSESDPNKVAIVDTESAFIFNVELGTYVQLPSTPNDLITSFEFGENPSTCFLGKQKTFSFQDTRSENVDTFLTMGKKLIKILQSDPYLALGDEDSIIRLYDARVSYRKPLQKYNEHNGSVRALLFKDGKLYSGGGIEDRTIKTWELHQPKSIDSKLVDAQILDIHSYGTHLLSLQGGGPEHSQSACLWSNKMMLKISMPISAYRPLFSHVFQDKLVVGCGNSGNNSTEFSVIKAKKEAMT